MSEKFTKKIENAARDKENRNLTITELVERSKERGRRQTPKILHEAMLKPTHKVRDLSEYQLDRLVAVLSKEEIPPWPQEATPKIHS